MSVGPAEHARLAELAAAERIPGVGDRSWLDWASDVADRAASDLFDVSMPALGTAAPWIAGAVGGVAVVVAILVVVRLVGAIRRARRVLPDPVVVRALATPLRPAARSDVEAHLAGGDAFGALHALLRWVGASLEARGLARFLPDRTNRELLAEVRRTAPQWEHLATFARLTDAADGLLYAGLPLDPPAVRALLPLADELVA